MSAIAALYNPDGRRVQRRHLQRIAGTLGHRGLDGCDLWTEGQAGLARCFPSLGSEPARQGRHVETHGPLAAAADARLDNSGELLAALGWHKREAGPVSDTRLILGAYEQWGERCPSRLIGDFAFVLWDARNRRFFCARDHFGIKPLYYFESAAAFAFATEIKALLALPWVQRRPNEARIGDYLLQVAEDPESTFYECIRRVPPGHSLTITSEGRMRRSRYWSLDAYHEIRQWSDKEYAEVFREIFFDAVRCRTGGSCDVGSMLSGGFDSSSVTCVARRILATAGTRRLQTFSWIFDDVPECDERSYIESVVAEGGLDAHYVHGDRVNPLRDLDKMLWHLDEPFFTPNVFLYWELYRQARAAGVSVILDGFMGDNVVSHGSRYLTELASRGRWLRLGRELRATARALRGNRGKTYRYLIRDFVLGPLLVERLKRAWVTLRKPVLPASPQSRFVNIEFARDAGLTSRILEFGKESPGTSMSVRQEQLFDLRSGAYSHVFEVIDKTAAAFRLTPRFPFTDRRLVEFCMAVPATQKYRDGWTRVYARRGLSDDLPKKIRERYGKTYLGEVLRHGLFNLGRDELRAFVMDRISIAAPYVNVKAVEAAVNDAAGESGRRHPLAVTVSIWSAVVLACWLERERDAAGDR